MNPARGVIVLWVGLACGIAGAQALPYRHESCTEDKKVCLLTEQPDTETVSFTVTTRAHSTLTVTLDAEVENVELSTPLPVTTILEGSQTQTVLKLKRARSGQAWSYQKVRYYWNWGTPRAVHDDSVVYLLPFAPGRPVRVLQGYDGDYSHTGLMRYAVDFNLREGSPVHAARGGVVVEVVQHFTTAGTDASYQQQDKANRVLVRHEDNTLAYYGHLKPNAVVVKEGQYVKPGQLLGLSGNTGFSQGPHLHFEVHKPKDGRQDVTLPIRFRTEQGLGIPMEEGQLYTALP
jgi:murein DD-endopeptidase MepM/ murein hydrolase activator NlpD